MGGTRRGSSWDSVLASPTRFLLGCTTNYDCGEYILNNVAPTDEGEREGLQIGGHKRSVQLLGDRGVTQAGSRKAGLFRAYSKQE